MFILTAHIISHYTGSYTSFVKDRIFTPLGMTSTTFYSSGALRSGQMTQAWNFAGRRIPQWFTDEVRELAGGAGGIILSTEDMVHRTPRARAFPSYIVDGLVLTGKMGACALALRRGPFDGYNGHTARGV
jgi:CubicO group peptidase (beta-lactamase class C family)